MNLSTWTCLRCGHEWMPRRTGKPRNCPNQKCRSVAWDRERPAHAERPLTYRRLYPEIHELPVGGACFLAFDSDRINKGWGDPHPERCVNYQRRKYGKKFEVMPTAFGLNVRRLA